MSVACSQNSAPVPDPAVGKGKKSLVSSAPVSFVDPLPRWKEFLTERLGGPPEPSLVGDFNGDGTTDIASRIGQKLYFFGDVTEPTPSSWKTVEVPLHATLKVRDAAWFAQQMSQPIASLLPGQSLVVAGELAPLVYFWYPQESSFAWLQVLPATLQNAREHAEASVQAYFGISKNNLSGEKGFYGEEKLAQGFAGDFDQDGELDLVVVDNRAGTKSKIVFYGKGAIPPTIHDVEYAGTKMSVILSNKPTEVGSAFDKPAQMTLKGDYLYLEMPEKSSAIVFMQGDEWRRYWQAD